VLFLAFATERLIKVQVSVTLSNILLKLIILFLLLRAWFMCLKMNSMKILEISNKYTWIQVI